MNNQFNNSNYGQHMSNQFNNSNYGQHMNNQFNNPNMNNQINNPNTISNIINTPDILYNTITENNIDNIDNIEIPLRDTQIHLNLNTDKSKKSKKSTTNNIDTNNICAIFDNSLDGIMKSTKTQSNINHSLKSSYIIVSIVPVDITNAHFNNIKYPNEKYKVIMCENKETHISNKGFHETEIQNASDINNYALATNKYIYEHNIGACNYNEDAQTFIYARTSNINDCSIDTQIDSCLNYAKTHDFRLLPFGIQYDSNISARNMQNLNHELGFWAKHIPNGSNLIMYSVDRLSRHLSLGLQFLDSLKLRNIKIHFVINSLIYSKTMNATTKCAVQLGLVNSETFSDNISEKIKNTLKRKREEGNYIGGRPGYGYKIMNINNIKTKVPNDEQQHIIKKIMEHYKYYMTNNNTNIKQRQTTIVNEILRYCNRSGFKNNNTNTLFTVKQIQNIIKKNHTLF